MAVRSPKESRQVNDWKFCPGCGTELPARVAAEEIEAEEHAAETEEVTDAAVKIAEIEAKRDVTIARISAGVAESDREADLAHAEGKAEGFEEALAPDEPAEPGIVIVDAPETEEPAEEPVMEMPEPEEHHDDIYSGYGNSTWFGGH
jgi:hypothetical protein